MDLFKISGQSGMMKTNTLDALVLVSSPSNGIYGDSKIIDGKMIYTGEGLIGDQQLNKNNKTLYESLENNLDVYLFTKDEEKNYTFEGKVKLYDIPYQTYEPDEEGNNRIVWKFPLQIIYLDFEEKVKRDSNFLKLVDEIENIEKNVMANVEVSVNFNKEKLLFIDEPLKIRKYRESSEKRQKVRNTKPDYIAEEIIKIKQGIINENTIFNYELELLKKQNAKEQIKKMKEFFETKKDNEGYDILTYELNEYGEYIEKYIEVKSTKGEESVPIDITENEILFAKEHIEQYYIYRIIKSDSDKRYVKIVTGKDLFEKYELVPTVFKVYSK